MQVGREVRQSPPASNRTFTNPTELVEELRKAKEAAVQAVASRAAQSLVSQGGLSQGASIEGQWEGPEGGLWFDASGQLCQLDIMHTFMFGRWEARDADSVTIQFYDVRKNPAVLDRPEMRTTARVSTAQGRRVFDLLLPDKSTLRFRYLGPTKHDFSEVESLHHKR